METTFGAFVLAHWGPILLYVTLCMAFAALTTRRFR